MRRKYSDVFQFKIVLDEIQPTIWRRIQVPGTYTFWDLHVAVQDVMGWFDYHLHEFEIHNPGKDRIEQIGIPYDEFDDGIVVIGGWNRRIARYFSEENNFAAYRYDFGDNWRHTVIFEKFLPRVAGIKYPICLDGERACPPEDVGGVPGYGRFAEAMLDPNHEEYESYITWVGEGFQFERFDPKAVVFDDPQKRWKNAFQYDGEPD